MSLREIVSHDERLEVYEARLKKLEDRAKAAKTKRKKAELAFEITRLKAEIAFMRKRSVPGEYPDIYIDKEVRFR